MDAFDVVKSDDAWRGVRDRLLEDKWRKIEPNKKTHRLTVGGQIHIVEVMIVEEVQREEFWKSEWACAKNLLDCPLDGQVSVKVRDMKVDQKNTKKYRTKIQRKLYSVRTGGGYLYQADEREIDAAPTPSGRNPWQFKKRKRPVARVPPSEGTDSTAVHRPHSVPARSSNPSMRTASSLRSTSIPPNTGLSAAIHSHPAGSKVFGTPSTKVLPRPASARIAEKASKRGGSAPAPKSQGKSRPPVNARPASARPARPAMKAAPAGPRAPSPRRPALQRRHSF